MNTHKGRYDRVKLVILSSRRPVSHSCLVAVTKRIARRLKYKVVSCITESALQCPNLPRGSLWRSAR
jgi:hypothetical protein